MKFFAIHLADLEGEAFSGATDEQIVTWLFLHAFCSKQLNGGEIVDVAEIPPRFWLRHGIVHHHLLLEPSPLWEVVDGALKVKPYDIDGQTLYEKKSRSGKATAAKRWGARSTPQRTADSSPISSPSRTPISSPDAHNSTRPNSTRPEKTAICPPSRGDADGSTLLEDDPPIEKSPKSPRAHSAIDSDVARIWEIYPSSGRNRSSKKQAADAWRKARPRPDIEDVLRVLRLWVSSEQWKKDGGQYVLGVHRWISNRSWEAEPEARTRPLIDIGGRRAELLDIDIEDAKRQLGGRAETLVAACPFPDLTIPALEAAAACIGRHPGRFEEILAACQAITALYREWPENERIAFRSTAERFFREDQWRKSPDAWRSRRAARVASNGAVLPLDIGRTAPQGGDIIIPSASPSK